MMRYEKCLKIQIEVFNGHDHISVAKSYLGIGDVYFMQGHYDNALAEYEKCLKIQIEVVGHDHT